MEAKNLGNLGILYRNLGECDKAISHLKLALQISVKIGDKANESSALGNLGIVYQNLGQYDEAIFHYNKSIQISQNIGDKLTFGTHLGNLGIVYQIIILQIILKNQERLKPRL